MTEPRQRYVYFASFEPGFIKIGCSVNPRTRIRRVCARQSLTPIGVNPASGRVMNMENNMTATNLPGLSLARPEQCSGTLIRLALTANVAQIAEAVWRAVCR